MKGSNRKRGNTFTYKVYVGKDPVTGKRFQKAKGGFKSEAAARKVVKHLI